MDERGRWGVGVSFFFNVLKKLSSIAFSNLPLSVLKSFILINVIGSLNFFLSKIIRRCLIDSSLKIGNYYIYAFV